MAYATFSALLEGTEEFGSISSAAIAAESEGSGQTAEQIRSRMHDALRVMREAIHVGRTGEVRSNTGLTGGDAAKIVSGDVGSSGQTRVLGGLFAEVIGSAVATGEVNAAMGRIVAAPTAGASGVVPGVLISVANEHGLDDEAVVDALFVAGVIGGIFAARATLSGAAGGCQAEIGTGAAMAAGAVCSMLGGNPSQVGHAASLAMQGLLGLACDPVGGLVEVPCVMRNATGAAVALAGAEMALAGVEFPIPLDDVVLAVARVGASLPPSLRETARGGLAVTPSGLRLARCAMGDDYKQ